MGIERIDPELCDGCKICVSTCPMDVIRMDMESKKAIIKYPEDCMLCEWCALDCPKKAITVTPVKTARIMVAWG